MSDARNQGWKLLIILVIFAIASQTLGWITIADNYVYSINSCQYTLQKYIICNDVDYTNDPQHNHLEQGLQCPYLNREDCDQVQKTLSYVYAPIIGTMSIDAQTIIVYFFIFLNLDRQKYCGKCYEERCRNCQRVFVKLLFLLWILAYLIFAIVSFLAAQSFNQLADHLEQVTVNQNVFSNFIALGILLIIQMALAALLRSQANQYLDQIYQQISQEIPPNNHQGGYNSSFGIYPQNALNPQIPQNHFPQNEHQMQKESDMP